MQPQNHRSPHARGDSGKFSARGEIYQELLPCGSCSLRGRRGSVEATPAAFQILPCALGRSYPGVTGRQSPRAGRRLPRDSTGRSRCLPPARGSPGPGTGRRRVRVPPAQPGRDKQRPCTLQAGSRASPTAVSWLSRGWAADSPGRRLRPQNPGATRPAGPPAAASPRPSTSGVRPWAFELCLQAGQPLEVKETARRPGGPVAQRAAQSPGPGQPAGGGALSQRGLRPSGEVQSGRCAWARRAWAACAPRGLLLPCLSFPADASRAISGFKLLW